MKDCFQKHSQGNYEFGVQIEFGHNNVSVKKEYLLNIDSSIVSMLCELKKENEEKISVEEIKNRIIKYDKRKSDEIYKLKLFLTEEREK